MTQEEYIDKTRPMVNFLTHVFSDDVCMIASVQVAQAEQNTERLIDLLGLIKGRTEDWIQELKMI